MHLRLKFFAGDTPIYRVDSTKRKEEEEKKNDFEYAVEQFMRIDFVHKHIEHKASNLVFQSR